jgi:hypothetical protein
MVVRAYRERSRRQEGVSRAPVAISERDILSAIADFSCFLISLGAYAYSEFDMKKLLSDLLLRALILLHEFLHSLFPPLFEYFVFFF